MSLGSLAPVCAIASLIIAWSSRVRELGRKVALDQSRLGLLLVGQLRPAAVAKLLRGIQPSLALTAQHRDLIIRAFLGRLLELGQDHPKRSGTLALSGLQGGVRIAAQLLCEGHADQDRRDVSGPETGSHEIPSACSSRQATSTRAPRGAAPAGR